MRHLYDYHIHTDVSADCPVPMREQIESAIELGLKEICFTEHFDFDPVEYAPNQARPGHPRDGFLDEDIYDDIFQRCLREYGDRIELRQGAEAGEIHRFPELADQVLNAHDYDLILGSIHLFRGSSLSHDWPVVPETAKEAYDEFFANAIGLSLAEHFDVMAHLDIVKRHAITYYGPFHPEDYEEQIRLVLRNLIERGKGIEINTSGLRQKSGETLPSLTILRWYRELGGEILTIGSDSHRPQHVGYGLDIAREMALSVGFKAFTRFSKRKPIFQDFD